MKPEHKIEYYDNGQVACEYWRVNGQYHRLDGPAWVRYNQQGEIIEQEFWVRDQVDCAKLGQFICSPERWHDLLLEHIPIEFGIDYVVDLGLVDWWLDYRPQDREYLNEA